MKKSVLLFVVFIVFSLHLGAQDSQVLLDTYLSNFQDATKIDTKIKVLQNAVKTGSDVMGPLYHIALDYALNNSAKISTDTKISLIAIIAAEQIKKIGYKEAKYSLWQLFKIDSNTIVRVNVLETLSDIGKDDKKIIDSIIRWLIIQNNMFNTQTKPDNTVVGAAVHTLGKLKDASAFHSIFTTRRLSYSDRISALAKEALLSLEGDLKDMLISVIKDGVVTDKRYALSMGLFSERLDDKNKAELSEYALKLSINWVTNNRDDMILMKDMRYTAIRALSEMKWSKATSLIIEHFGMTLLEYDRGIASKAYLMESIDALGNMGTHEAAERLTIYLKLINVYTENNKAYDEQIVLAVLNNMKKLGDKVTFKVLTNIQNLNYSEKIIKAAQEAMDSLKW